jgi:hypothetical protein
MKDSSLGRRGVIGLLGMAFTGAVSVNAASAAPEAAGAKNNKKKTTGGVEIAVDAPAPVALLGVEANGYRITAVSPVQQGAFTLTLSNTQGDSFGVDVCAHDEAPGAARGLSRTEHLELFLINSGSGATPTAEAHGLAVMALGPALRAHEGAVQRSSLLTLRERLDQHGSSIVTIVGLARAPCGRSGSPSTATTRALLALRGRCGGPGAMLRWIEPGWSPRLPGAGENWRWSGASRPCSPICSS